MVLTHCCNFNIIYLFIFFMYLYLFFVWVEPTCIKPIAACFFVFNSRIILRRASLRRLQGPQLEGRSWSPMPSPLCSVSESPPTLQSLLRTSCCPWNQNQVVEWWRRFHVEMVKQCVKWGKGPWIWHQGPNHFMPPLSSWCETIEIKIVFYGRAWKKCICVFI